MVGIIIVSGMVALGFSFLSFSKNPDRYKFLFRNTIFSSGTDVYPTRKGFYELAPVMRGRVYMPNYFFLPERNQYLVKSSLEFSQISRHDPYAPPGKKPVRRHVLLDAKGRILSSLDTDVNFSRHSGLFFGATYYIDWLQTGASTENPYTKIFNQDLRMSQETFVNSFRKLYMQADYIEYVRLRTHFDDEFEAGIVFKIQGKWQILLSGVDDSRMWHDYTEADERTAIWEDNYRVRFNYHDSSSHEEDPYPPSPASVQIIPLETDTPAPYRYKRLVGNRELIMDKYFKQEATGWQGIAEVKGLPIYIPGSSTGIAYMRLKLGKETFRFKIPEVEKADYLPVYNLGLRLFKLPKNVRSKSSLVFLESTQNGGEDRPGGGVYVVREREGENFLTPSGDLPAGISEGRYAQLPLSLQESLLDIEGTTELSIESGVELEWFPEIELLENLTYLRIRTGLSEVPDGIGKLNQLEVLILEGNRISTVSPSISKLKQLKILDLYSNNLKSFPEGLLELNNLEELSIGANDGVTEIPAKIVGLQSLRSLDLLLLNITSLPDAIAEMTNLRIMRAEKLQQILPEKFQHLFPSKDTSTY